MQTLIKEIKTKPLQNYLTNKTYWLNQLTGELPETNILIDCLRPEVYRGKNKEISFNLSAELSQAVIKLTNGSSLSIYLCLLTAFNVLLHKYTNSNDLIVGIPSYRSPSNTSDVLPLRIDVDDRFSFKEFLLQVKENVISAYTHQDYAFEELLDLLAIPQAQNRCSLYDIVVLLENIHDRNCVANLNNDLTVSFSVHNSVIEGKIIYSQALFKYEAIATLVRHYLNVIETVVKNINTEISSIVLFKDGERDLLLRGFNDNAKIYPVDRTIHDLFAEQAKRTPNDLAVVYNQEQLTYQQLSDRVSKLAAFLHSLGVERGDLVGIYQTRNINFLISILSILKAGGAYVPLDCTYPRDRLKYMLINSEVKILLTQFSLLDLFADGLEDYRHLQHIICLDTNNLADTEIKGINLYSTEDIDRCETKNTENVATGKDKAYTIYTSGSTGLPKGAIIRHDGAINHIYAQFDALELQPGFSFLQSAPASSDISVWQFLAPILFGGKTVIADKETICNPDRLFELIKQEKLTLVELVPVVLSSLLDYVSQLSSQERFLPNLQCMMITGEYVAVELVNRWLSLYPEIKVANAYGPTEASDDITQYIINEPLAANQKTVPIGKPLANNSIYIVNSQMQLQPIGIPGEICVSGIGVGDGYWRNETKTKECFVPNPFAVRANGGSPLLYRTGDLGKWLPDGNIEFLGRIDHQVKIRGFRIELGEIETVLSQHPTVSSAVVILREDTPEDKRLVAYVVPHKDNDTDELPTILRNFLKAKLPEYAIPSNFIFLDALPLTPSGKVDRQGLPAPEINRDNQEKSDILPRTPVEEVIAGVWSQVLKTDCVSINDHFFDRGGHSLLATQLISRLRQIFQIELPLRYVFEFPTIAELAKGVESMKQSQNVLEIPPLVPVSRDDNLPLTYAQEGLWFIQQLNPDLPIYNSPAAVRLTGSLNIPAFEKSLNEILRRHEALRTRFTLVEGKPVQVIVPNLTLKIPVVSLEDLPEAEREEEFLRLADKEAKLPFDLAKPPLLRVTLLKLSATDYVALFTMHHIATDGWSIAILIQELSTLYEAFSTETPSPLPELTIQYADFAHWQRQWLQGEVLAEKLDYWQQQLAGIPTSLNLEKLAVNKPKTKQNRECAVRSFLLPPELSTKIKALSSQEGVTLFMTLLASFQTLLYRYTNQEDIIVGTDVANRDRPELEAIVGFFVNLLLLRGDLSGNPTFRELLERVRETTLAAYDRADVPFAKLVEALRPDRTSSVTPLFQVLFVLQNVPMPAFELSGLQVEVMELNTGLARFDLALFMEETAAGIKGTWKYRSDLFTPDAIARITDNLQTLLCGITDNPDTPIDTLKMLSESQKQEQVTTKKAKFNKFKRIKPKAVTIAQQELITTSYLQPKQHLPLVIQPNNNDIDLADWACNHREYLENNLLQHGAILFRGFQTDTVSKFERVASAICPQLFANYGDLPREGKSEKVYKSTPYPSDRAILFHNESSHLHQYPLKIWFFCVQPAQQGGETPIVDCHRVYQLLNPKLRSHLENQQLMYVRNYIEGLDVSWQDFFHTSDKNLVEQYCRESETEFEWLPNNGLRTRKVRPAISPHPKTGKSLFFNQVQLHHISYLEPEVRNSLLSTFGEANLPRNVYYSDGASIEDSVMAEINAAYQQAQVSFPWQQGDILMLDNMRVAHARNSYTGDRKIAVAMGEMNITETN
ncbi:non-ribosomal peptide synthetase [Myxosarcina sp. GI1]|uniref:non-ribosomal peptide synthetase n=1 Tax=Myxosarcina sp. GI1 TaxID=1541065 RepID=UPI00055E8B3E|nr:non-ribosomal peptide synthetase [Myxosarcina sp. GI1]